MSEHNRKREKSVTMRDIANHLNIDRTTVSKAMAGHPRVSDETIAKVKAAAAELGYQKDNFASGLMTGRNAILGIVLSDELNRGIYASFVKSFQRAAGKQQYGAILFHTGRNEDDMMQAIQLLKQQRVSGVTFVARTNELVHETYMSQLVQSGIAINTTGHNMTGSGIDSVVFDHHGAGLALTRHLLDLGHTNIVLLTHKSGGQSGQERFAGYKQAMRDAGLELRVMYGAYVPAPMRNHVQMAYQLVKEAYDRWDDIHAFIGINDDFALGTLFALKELGIVCPEQVSVAGFDDSHAMLGIPALTTMRLPLQELGETTGTMLLDRIYASGQPAVCKTMQYELIVRDSTSTRHM